jgi:hypothetical protein
MIVDAGLLDLGKGHWRVTERIWEEIEMYEMYERCKVQLSC